MGKINYSCLRGRIEQFQPAPVGNPHLWMLIRSDLGVSFFATVNVKSSKGLPGQPDAANYLNFFVDDDFRHPIITRLRSLEQGMTKQDRTYAAGALDFIKGNLFDPRHMRVLPNEATSGNDLTLRLEGLLGVARANNDDIVIVGSQFQTSPNQTKDAFGETPVLGIDNTHMAQGDPPEIDQHLHENGPWHDGAIFLLSAASDRVTAIFLAFQTQAWQTDDAGQARGGTTGYEAPRYDHEGGGLGNLEPNTPSVAELTSLNRLADGTGRLVVTNMTNAALDLTGWSVLAPSGLVELPATSIGPGQPLAIDLAADLIDDSGGILSLVNPDHLKVDGVAYLGGATSGWSTSFAP